MKSTMFGKECLVTRFYVTTDRSYNEKRCPKTTGGIACLLPFHQSWQSRTQSTLHHNEQTNTRSNICRAGLAQCLTFNKRQSDMSKHAILTRWEYHLIDITLSGTPNLPCLHDQSNGNSRERTNDRPADVARVKCAKRVHFAESVHTFPTDDESLRLTNLSDGRHNVVQPRAEYPLKPGLAEHGREPQLAEKWEITGSNEEIMDAHRTTMQEMGFTRHQGRPATIEEDSMTVSHVCPYADGTWSAKVWLDMVGWAAQQNDYCRRLK